MYFGLTTEYALRAIAYLALLPNDEAIRCRDLSQKVDVPVHYLSKIMGQLVSAGLVRSQKGHGGGFQLEGPSKYISFGDVLRSLESMPEINDCLFGWGRCQKDHPCPLHHLWEPMSNAFFNWADTTTLDKVQDFKGFNSWKKKRKCEPFPMLRE